ncbi:MAG: hypothetical protein HZB16_24325 [Armatimonadetes bacterium]|nr:hypothetical protein [Armatimonadota bacterium]
MRACAVLLSLWVMVSSAWADATLDNAHLRLTVSGAGALEVQHKDTGRLWTTAAVSSAPRLAVPRCAKGPVVDGRSEDWPAGRTMLPGGSPTFAARFTACWDAAACYFLVEVTDAKVAFPAQPRLRWWDDDSVEVWLGSQQIGASLSAAGDLASRIDQPAKASVAHRLVPGGYVVEAAVPWPEGQAPASVPLAVGVNNADQPGTRVGQLYYPSTWQHSQPTTFAQAVLTGPDGRLPTAPVSGAAPTARELAVGADGRLTWQETLSAGGKGFDAAMTAWLEDQTLHLEWTAPAETPMADVAWPPPLRTDLADGRISFTPYCDGLLVPWDDPGFKWRSTGPAFDLPYIGLTAGPLGDGYALMACTPHDTALRLTPVGDKQVPQAVWLSQMGRVGSTRRMRYEFVPRGGYVALAKRFRQIGVKQGFVDTLTAKTRRTPATTRLGGAPNVWGGDAAWGRAAWAAGFEWCLFNYTGSPEQMNRFNTLGWLTSRYDNYADMFTEADRDKWDNVRGGQDEVLIAPDGKQVLAWLTWDKKTQYLKRSSAAMLRAAQRSVPPDLRAHPYNARFLDVTTADALFEDWRDGARQTRVDDVARRLELFRYVNSLGLVTGGEHGRFWAVPTMAYVEGMMSTNNFSWPAGHLLKPEGGRAGISDDYRRLGLGDRGERVPLWELVFHDCSVSYWYWGDSTDYLWNEDPTITDRKDALNVLYGTPPMYWAARSGFDGSKPEQRRRLLQSRDRTCLWHRVVYDRELVDHAALSTDRLVQRSTFAGGYEAIVNLAPEPRKVTVAGTTTTLPPNGFVAQGPDAWVEYSLGADGQPRTRIKTPGRRMVEGASVPGLTSAGRALAMTQSTERIDIAAEGAACEVEPARIVPGWQAKGTRVFELDADGLRLRALPIALRDGRLALPATTRRLAIQTGSATRQPDVQVGAVTLSPVQPVSAVPLTVATTLSNAGQADARGAVLVVRVDGVEAARRTVTVPGLTSGLAARLMVPTSALDGRHRLALAVELAPDQVDQVAADNVVESFVDIALDLSHRVHQKVGGGTVRNPGPARTEAVVAVDFPLPTSVDGRALRVVGPDGSLVPTQFEPGTPGQLVFQIPGRIDSGASWRYEVQRVEGLAGGANLYLSEGGRRVVTPVYSATLSAGLVRDLALAGRAPLITHIMYSSAETGWNDEPGSGDLTLVAGGPVRLVMRADRRLQGGTHYAKTYTFTADTLRIDTVADPSVTGLHNRLYLAPEPLTLTNSAGKSVTIDGRGDDEVGPAQPEWIALYGPRGACAMVAERATSSTYWDAGGSWGGVGFHHDPKRSREWLVFRANAADASFAKEAGEQCRQPVTVLPE